MVLRDLWKKFIRCTAIRGYRDDSAQARSGPKKKEAPRRVHCAWGPREEAETRRAARCSRGLGGSGSTGPKRTLSSRRRLGHRPRDSRKDIGDPTSGTRIRRTPRPPRKASGPARCLCSRTGFQAQPPPGTHNRCRGPIGDGQVLRPILLRAARVFAIRGSSETERCDKQTMLRRHNTTRTTVATRGHGERQAIVGKRWSGALRGIPRSTGNC